MLAAVHSLEVKRKDSYRLTAKKFNLPESTLRRWATNGVPAGKPQGGRTTFFKEYEEKKLAEHISYVGQMGYSYLGSQIREIAGEMARILCSEDQERKCRFTDFIPGRNWYYGFLTRWKNIIRPRRPSRLDHLRAEMSRRSILEAYFGKLLEVLEKYNLRDCPAQIYNVDETGITRDHKPPKSLGPSQGAFNAVSCGRGPIHTIIACGNAMGNRLTPYIIFKGARVRQEWTEGTLSGTGYNATKTGWSNSATFLQWFKGHFLPQVGSVRPLLLLYDGHSTHISVQIIEEARLEGVHLFVTPPHTSHILQPLDVGCFAPFKATYNRAVHNWLHKYKNTGCILVEEDIASLACKAYMMGISSDSLVSSFRCTGICPFNPDVVLSKLPEQPERGSSSIDGPYREVSIISRSVRQATKSNKKCPNADGGRRIPQG
ncbi:jerky protein homolog-like [Patiria miniata]|uniref:DDE-1 domain-containing protein n=1 Tax=Patiria miniata TaxID=46514 RepID=A0A914BFE2_PATMI|nr:jerky protein homolog-like [Patiria miniata]